MPAIIYYIAGGILLLSVLAYFFQEKFIFKPEKLKQDFEFRYDAPFREYFFDIEPGVRINGLHFFREEPKGLILYFHGNTRSIKGWAKYARDFYRYDYDVVLLDYRGFGKSTGKRSEKEMLNDMQFIYEKLREQYKEDHLTFRSWSEGISHRLDGEGRSYFSDGYEIEMANAFLFCD